MFAVQIIWNIRYKSILQGKPWILHSRAQSTVYNKSSLTKYPSKSGCTSEQAHLRNWAINVKWSASCSPCLLSKCGIPVYCSVFCLSNLNYANSCNNSCSQLINGFTKKCLLQSKQVTERARQWPCLTNLHFREGMYHAHVPRASAVLFPIPWQVLLLHSNTDTQHGLTANSQCADYSRDLILKDPACKQEVLVWLTILYFECFSLCGEVRRNHEVINIRYCDPPLCLL